MLDTGSVISHFPVKDVNKCQKGYSSFECKYLDGYKAHGTKAVMTINSSWVQIGDDYDTIDWKLVGGINNTKPEPMIGLRYLENLESLAYIWNSPYMIFVPPSSNLIGFGSGRLELSTGYSHTNCGSISVESQ
jgi:hypothetical protein